MRLSATLFREYDVRGRVPEVFPDAKDELSDEGMRWLGRAFGTLARKRGRTQVVVGHDLRTYSERLKDRFVEGRPTLDSGRPVQRRSETVGTGEGAQPAPAHRWTQA